MGESLSQDHHEVGQNEDDVQHVNVLAPGSGKGKFAMIFFLTLVFVSNMVYII
jgi:hypothetical protein